MWQDNSWESAAPTDPADRWACLVAWPGSDHPFAPCFAPVPPTAANYLSGSFLSVGPAHDGRVGRDGGYGRARHWCEPAGTRGACQSDSHSGRTRSRHDTPLSPRILRWPAATYWYCTMP